MDAFYERLLVRSATIDELLSDDFEILPGQKRDADLAARRLAAWCRSCSSGDWSLFDLRLDRDGLSISQVLAKFATVRRRVCSSIPRWIEDAIWIEAALQRRVADIDAVAVPGRAEPGAFEHLFAPAVERAEALLWTGIDRRAFDNLTEPGRACLRDLLLDELCGLCAPAIYERFVKAVQPGARPADPASPDRNRNRLHYVRFIAEMQAAGLRRLFEEKPVLLRLIATVTRQWIDTSRELVMRLDADLATIRRDILQSDDAKSRISKIEGELSDPHNNGHSVRIVSFEDGCRVVYKPKDLRLAEAWHALIARLNLADPPAEIKAVRTVVRDGYGWTEFIDHMGCADREGFERFFRRAGAWLALFHCFAASDMHQENMIAAGDHPVPIDLETILQAAFEEQKTDDPEHQAFEFAVETVANSVSMVGLLPAYGRSPENKIYAVGGMTSRQNSKTKRGWKDINSDTMRPWTSTETNNTMPNLPHVDGRYAKFGDHIDSFVSGFADYAKFLMRYRDCGQREPFDGFAGLPVRKVLRPTQFYYLLLQRLKDHRTMDDGVSWAAQIDFIARLADWDRDSDPIWPLQRAERRALAALNVPHFVSRSDGHEICDATGISMRTEVTSGLDRARARAQNLDEQDITWQIEVIRQNTGSVSTSAGQAAKHVRQLLRSEVAAAPPRDIFIAEAEKIAEELSGRAIRRGPSAAWIGVDWLGDSEVSQLVPLGPDLYSGVSGIAVFLAAHADATGREAAGALALAGIAGIRRSLRSQTAARMARSLGLGGATGLGSVVYALSVMSKCLNDDQLLVDAHVAAELFTDDLIAADKQLDVIGGSAGGILSLLRLYRDTQSGDVLKRAIKCGEHLLSQRRIGPEGRRSWSGQASAPRVLNGMSHGAAGFAYALASLSAATGREEFASAASECIAWENYSYDAERRNWPDLRSADETLWPCRWCHGAPGIGLARIAMARLGGPDSKLLVTDIRNALDGVERGWPSTVDTLCCGTLGSVELFCEAGDALGRPDLRDVAAQRLMSVLETAALSGDYRWNAGKRQFNLGLFGGLAGVGYTFLRQVDRSLPNIIIWE